MIQLRAISYHNIGPFANRNVTVFFQTGKYLIKAPIGSGKSFLFFDGPVYGLYKHASRKMLNSTCSSGSIKLWVDIDDVQYCIIRKLKKGKSKDQCSSQLFILSGTSSYEAESSIIDGDIEEILKANNVSFEEVVCKNETDVQAIVTSVLPPREVFTSTVLLMQDSPNIFELSPTERITVFKNVFGLLGIDEAKDAIADKKREVQMARKIYSDSSRQDSKLNELIQTALPLYKKIADSSLVAEHIAGLASTMSERELFVSKLTLEGFQLETDGQTILSQCSQVLTQELGKYQELEHLVKSKQDAYNKEIQNYQSQTQTLNTIEIAMKKLEQTIASANIEDIENIKKKKSSLQEHIQGLLARLPHKILHQNAKILALLDTNDTNLNFHQRKQLIDIVIKEGKYLAEKIDLLAQQAQGLQKQKELLQSQIAEYSIQTGSKAHGRLLLSLNKHKNQLLSEKATGEKQIQSLQEHIDAYREQEKLIQERMNSLSTAIEQQSTFHCEKLELACPYIQLINKKSLGQLETQLNELTQEATQKKSLFEQKNYQTQLEQLQQHIKHIDISLLQFSSENLDNNSFLKDEVALLTQEKERLITQLNDEKFDQKHAEFIKESALLDSLMSEYKTFLHDIEWKNILGFYHDFCEYEKELSSCDQQITQREKITQTLEHTKQELTNKKTEYGLLSHQSLQQKTLLTSLNDEILLLKSDLAKEPYTTLSSLMTAFDQFYALWNKIEELITDFKQRQKDALRLAEQEKRLTQLYKIFSKELLYVVLESSLPTLNEIINSYLAQVVEYSLEMTIKEENDQLTMEALIQDEKGTRDINSLSGGQKTILKLVWMLAVTSYMRSSMLFLDETINNLDADTVSSVADMLHDFIKQHNISFYTVTHSQQIQQMGIRDSVITL